MLFKKQKKDSANTSKRFCLSDNAGGFSPIKKRMSPKKTKDAVGRR